MACCDCDDRKNESVKLKEVSLGQKPEKVISNQFGTPHKIKDSSGGFTGSDAEDFDQEPNDLDKMKFVPTHVHQ